MKNNGFTWEKRLKSFVYAFRGIQRLIQHEPNARIHCFAAICAIALGIILRVSPTEWITITILIGLVLAAEAFNSSIEALADKVSPEYDEAIKHTKDLAAGAVLILAIAAAITGIIIFVPRLLEFMSFHF